MATQRQYEFFKLLYDEEESRTKTLREHGKHDLTLATFYSAFTIFVVEKLPPVTLESKCIFLLCVGCMILAFAMSLYATQVSDYEALNNPADILDTFGEECPTDEKFFDDRIIDVTVAITRNSLVNDKKAKQLGVARTMLIAGIILAPIYLAVQKF